MSANTKMKTFKFLDIFDNDKTNYSNYCLVSISVEEKLSGGHIIYDISYTYKFSENLNKDLESKRSHPFYYSNIITKQCDLDGVITIKNNLTEKLVEFLLMDESELIPLIGSTWWMQYKIKIMESLSLLWD